MPKLTEINNEYEKQHQLELDDKYNSTIKERNNEYDKYLSNLNTEVEESKKVQDSIENISPDTLEELGYKQKGYLKEIREEQQQFSGALTRIDTASVESLLPKKEDVEGYYDELLAEQREFQSQLDAIETTPIDNLKRDQYSEILSEQADGQMALNLSATEYNDTLSTQNDLSNQRVLTLSEETDGQMALVMAENEGVSAKQKDIAETTSQIAAKEALTEASNKELLSNVNEKLAKTGVTSATEELTIAKLREIAASNEEGSALAKETLEMLGLGEASKATSIALKGLAMVGNMIAAWAIAEVLQLAIKGLDELANSVDNCKERVDNLMSSYQTALDTANSNASRVEELASDYEKLSKGVNNLGENVSLTSEEYEQYNSLVSEIADMFPTLIQGYNDQGIAILNLKGNVEGLRDAYKEAQTEAYNTLIASGENGDGNDIIKQWEDVHDPGFFAGLFDLGSADVGGKISVSDALAQLEEIQKLTAEEYRNIENIAAAGSHKEIESLTDIQKEIGYGSYIGKALGIDGNVTDKEFEEAKKQAKALVQTYNAEIESALSDVETLANAYLMTNDDYSKLTDNSKTAASLLVNNLTEDIASDFSSKEDVGSWVDSLVSKLQNNPTLSNAINDLFTTDLSNMSVDEAKAVVDQYINTIAKILEEDPVDVKVRLGFDDYNDDDIAPLKTKVQGFLKDEFDDKVGELSLDDLQVASKLEIPEGTLLSWDELKQKIEETKNTASEETFSIPDTDTLQQQISDLNSTIDSIQSAYDTLTSACEEYNSNGGQLSIDTIQSLLSLSDEYLACLQVENGQLSLNADAMAQLAQAKLDEAQATAVAQALTELQAIANGEAAQSTTTYISGNAALMDSLAKLSGSYEGVAQAAMTAAQAQELSAQIESASNKDKTATENVLKGLDTKLKLIQSTKNAISAGNFASVAKKPSSSGSSSKSSKDELKEQFQAEYDLLKHNLEMNYITEEQYYNGVQALNEKYYAGKSEYLDEYRKYEEEVYKGLKSYYKSYCDSMVDYYEKALDANKISFGKYVTDVTALVKSMWDTGKISAEDYWNYVHDILTKQINIYDSVISAATQLLEDEIDKLNDEIDALEEKNDALNKEKDNYDSILSVVDDVYQKEIDKLNEQKEILQDKIDAINDANDALDLQYRKSEAIYALQKAQQQRSKKVYNGTEFVYTTDKEAIRDAQKTLQDIETEELINNLEKEQKALDKEIEKLEEFKDKWSDVTEAYKKNINEQLAIARWGKDYEAIILSNRIEDINNFKNQYISIQKQVDDNQSTIDSINEKIDYYNKLKDKWGEVAKTYEEQQNRIHAAEVLGQDYEKQVLSGRLDTIQNFTNSYVDLCKKQAEAAQNAADAVVKANQQAQNSTPTTASTPAPSTSSSGGSAGGGGSATTTTTPATNSKPYWTYRRKSSTGYSTEAQAKSNIGRFGGNGVAKSGSNWYVVQWLTGYATNTEASKATLQSKQNNKAHREEYGYYKRYFKGTDDAEPGLATVSEDGDELVVKDDKAELIHGEQFYNFEGGERVIPADETKEILKNQGNVEPLDSEIITHDGIVLKPVHPEYENLLTNFMKANPDYMYSMPNPATDSYKDILKGIENVNYDNRNVNNSVSIGEIHLHEVNDVDGFAKAIIRELPGKVNQALNRR